MHWHLPCHGRLPLTPPTPTRHRGRHAEGRAVLVMLRGTEEVDAEYADICDAAAAAAQVSPLQVRGWRGRMRPRGAGWVRGREPGLGERKTPAHPDFTAELAQPVPSPQSAHDDHGLHSGRLPAADRWAVAARRACMGWAGLGWQVECRGFLRCTASPYSPPFATFLSPCRHQCHHLLRPRCVCDGWRVPPICRACFPFPLPSMRALPCLLAPACMPTPPSLPQSCLTPCPPPRPPCSTRWS